MTDHLHSKPGDVDLATVAWMQADRLRQRAQARFDDSAALQAVAAPQLSEQATQKVLHELQVHQIELEMQNDELQRAQLALEASRARYFDLYDLAPVGYLTVSAQGLILEANLSVATMLGVARGALAKQPLSRFIAKFDQDVYYHCRQQLIDTGQAQNCELQVLQGGNATLWVKLNISAVSETTDCPVLRVILSDISDRKKLDDALYATNRSLQAARIQADRANLAKSEFLSSMSHELRSPLNAILGFAQLMEAGTPAPTPSQRNSLAQILKRGWYLLQLVNDILDLAAIESGKAALSMEDVPLAAVMVDCQDLVEPLAMDKSVMLRFTSTPQPWSVQADPTRLKQVLINLLSNAIKYNTPGGLVEVSYSTPNPQRLRISVRDTGPGLAANQLAQLFQPFNRLGQETSATKGTGIGLVVSQRLVTSMGGELGVTSTVGVGSVFWFELNLSSVTAVAVLPVKLDPAPDVPPATPAVTVATALPVSSGTRATPATVAAHLPMPRSVLYVEDNPANVTLIEQLLVARADIHLLSAQDALQGIAMARSRQPEVIVMDIHLPGISGLEAMKILQADPTTAHIPVLALSANAMSHDIEKGLAAGFYAYQTKPIKVHEFMAALDQGLVLAAKAPNGTNNLDAI
ncbi:MAG: ATP-binding protein [Rhodoferax sp.]|nr:ATP-binding protein [Rhodoferax sp.]